MQTSFQKPFLKWVGGKTQIIKTILSQFPDTMENYHEIFLGGGSVLFALLTLQKEGKIIIKGKIYAYDLNKSLINVYLNIQNNKESLYNSLYIYINEYSNIESSNYIVNRKPQNKQEALLHKENYYYWARTKYNTLTKEESLKDNMEISALFIFLNKTCFRGLYREGPNGFNVPYGHYKKTPKFINKTELDLISELIKNVTFRQLSFQYSILNINQNDFAYLDPPYVPVKSTSFVNYNVNGFNQQTHIQLFTLIKKQISDKHAKFLMSNSNVKLVTDAFINYQIQKIIAKRAINSKNPGEKIMELLIKS